MDFGDLDLFELDLKLSWVCLSCTVSNTLMPEPLPPLMSDVALTSPAQGSGGGNECTCAGTCPAVLGSISSIFLFLAKVWV